MSDQPHLRQPDEIFCHNCGALIKRDSRFCPRCGIALAATTLGTAADTLRIGEGFPPFPLRYDVGYPERLSRLLIFVKVILAIPQFLIVYALGYVTGVITLIAAFAILFTKRYPLGLFNVVVGFNRWGANVTAYAGLLRDEYPPFSADPGKYPVTYEVAYPEKLNRWLPLVKWLLVLPNQLVLSFVFIAAFFAYVIAWFAILFTGRFPRGLFNFFVGVIRWNYRISAYTSLMRDEYPPYSTDRDAKPGGRASVIIGALVGVPYVVGIAAFFIFLTPAFSPLSAETHEVPISYESLLDGTPSQTIDVGGVDVTLVSADDPAIGSTLSRAPTSYRYISFTVDINNRDGWFALVDTQAFRLKDSSGREHSPELALIANQTASGSLAKGERVLVTAIFQIGENADPTELTYSPGFAAFLPFGERVRFLFQ